jgi:hypothetical protein
MNRCLIHSRHLTGALRAAALGLALLAGCDGTAPSQTAPTSSDIGTTYTCNVVHPLMCCF